jgi:hypothetical protein
MKHNGGRVLKHKVPDRQRKGFKGQVVHVDAHEAIQMLLKGPQVVHEMAVDEMPEPEELEDALEQLFNPESSSDDDSDDDSDDSDEEEEV